MSSINVEAYGIHVHVSLLTTSNSLIFVNDAFYIRS